MSFGEQQVRGSLEEAEFELETDANEEEEEGSCLDLSSKSLGPVYKSPLDPRKYKALELPNGLKVVLISTLSFEEETEESAPKTCRLNPILEFNKVCLGLDKKSYKIRCECQQNPAPVPETGEKETSTTADRNKRKSSNEADRQERKSSNKGDPQERKRTREPETDAAEYPEEDDEEQEEEEEAEGEEPAEDEEEGESEEPEEQEEAEEPTDEEPALFDSEDMKILEDMLQEALMDELTSSFSTTDPDAELDEDDEEDEEDTQIAAAYLSVGAGWFNDPDDMPGMAHFVEHCFFLGSKKFPYPNQLFRLIFPHDGYANAYTTGNQTVYTIATSLNIFALALEMLADGVGFPLLPRELVAKEMDAVDAEYSLRQDDIPKYNQLLASLAKPGHPLRNADTGNKETLRVPNFYKKMVDWRANHYCANYMTLSLEAPLEMWEMEELVKTYFSDIPSSHLPSPRSRIYKVGNPFDMAQFNKIYRIPSIYHTEFIAIHWALEPKAWKNLSVKVLDYLGAVVEHKGSGGLYQFLTYFGWVTNVSAGGYDSDIFSNHYASTFTIYLDLTEDGFKNQSQLLQTTFAYLAVLSEQGPSKEFYEELQKEGADDFHQRAARETTSYCEDVCWWLHYVPAKYVLIAPELMTRFDPDLIAKYTNMLTLDACNIMVFSKNYLENEQGMDRMESFYHTPYKSEEISKELKDLVKNAKDALAQAFHLPKANPFLKEITCCGAQKLNLLSNGPLVVIPGKCTVLYKDEKFKTDKGPSPQSKFTVWLYSPAMHKGRKAETMMELFSYYFNEMIQHKFSSAIAAHFTIKARNSPGKLELVLKGPSQQLPRVMRDVFKILILFENLLDPVTFKAGKASYIEKMDNALLDNRTHAWEIMNFLWSSHYQLSTENIKQTEEITFPAFLDFVKVFKRKAYIVVQLNGFVTIEQSFNVVQTVTKFLQLYPDVVQPKEIKGLRCPQLLVGENIVKIRSKNLRTHTSVVLNGYQFGPLSKSDNKIVRFLVRCMGDEAYHQLRTLQQLGYIVSLYHDELFCVTSLILELVTQPKNFSTDYCNKRMDQFVADFYHKHLSNSKQFSTFMKDKPKEDVDFKRTQELYQQFLLPNAVTYRKLSVQVVGTMVDPYDPTQKTQIIQVPFLTHPLTGKPSRSQAARGKMEIKHFPCDPRDRPFLHIEFRKNKYPGAPEREDWGQVIGPTTVVACGDCPYSTVTRVIDNITRFKDCLQLYPSPESFKVDYS